MLFFNRRGVESAEGIKKRQSIVLNWEGSSNLIISMRRDTIFYKFKNLTRDEVDAMLGIVFENTRVYQEARAEGEVRGLAIRFG
jgi:predicted transposase YdaD